MNLAIGGNYDGNRKPEPGMEPATMEVDYVRVYELTGRPYREAVEPTIEEDPLPPDAKQAINGNYIYDTGYENGFTIIDQDGQPLDKNYWNFAYINTFGGNGAVSVDTIDNKKYAKVDITNAGGQPHSIQLIQHVPLAKGKYYKVSFDAKSSTNRNMNVKLGAGGGDRGWGVYSDSYTVPLTNQIKSYEYSFQMKENTDPLARLEMNMGTNGNTVWIGNVKVEEIKDFDPYNENATKEPLPNGNHVYNGTFNLGRADRMTYWNFNTQGAQAIASVDQSLRALHVDIANGGSDAEGIQLVQKGIQMLKGNKYKLTFNTKADQARTMKVELRSKDGATLYTEETFNIADSKELQGFTFDMTADNDKESQLVFLFGGNNADVYLSDVVMVQTNIDTSDQAIYPLMNGDFSLGMMGWNHFAIDGGSGTTTVVNGEANININGTGQQPHGIMLIQNMNLSKGIEYKLSFKAKSTVDRMMNVAVEINGEPYTKYFSQSNVELTTEMKQFDYEFTMPIDDSIGLKFLMGNIANVCATWRT